MKPLLIIITICSITFCGCTSDSPNSVVLVPVGPKLPKIDCDRYLERVAASVAARGIGSSGAGQQLLQEAALDCAERNSLRGY